jgi:hypothetical protein
MRNALASLLAAAALMVPAGAYATNYAIHLSGMCSTRWNGAPGGSGGGSNGGTPSLAAYTSYSSVEAFVDQTQSLSAAANSFKGVLDSYCTGSNYCYIYNYSMGDAVSSYVFDKLAWSYNIQAIITSAGAGGGSTLAGDIAKAVACPAAGGQTESAMRAAYNHQNGWNVGTTAYRLGGNKRLTASSVACVVGSAINFLTFGLVSGGTCLQSQNDGAVAYHSSGGYNNVGDYQTFWDGNAANHWSHNNSYFYNSSTCTGACTADYLNHYNMKMFGICNDGGIPGKSGRSTCVSYCSTL